MDTVYHAPVQLSLFSLQKQCSRCQQWFDNTPQYFFSNGKYMQAHCKKCDKKRKGKPERYAHMIHLTCSYCGKEFDRKIAEHNDNKKRNNTQRFYCSRTCMNKMKATHLPPTIAEEYIQGKSADEIAEKYNAKGGTVRKYLIEMGITPRRTDKLSQEKRIQASHRMTNKIATEQIAYVSKLEDHVAQELSNQGFAFIRQRGIRVPGINRYIACVDFMLADGRVIEVNGTYWHADPRKFPNGPINESQKRRVASDQRKQQILADHNIPLIVLWEIDLNADLSGTISKALSQ